MTDKVYDPEPGAPVEREPEPTTDGQGGNGGT